MWKEATAGGSLDMCIPWGSWGGRSYRLGSADNPTGDPDKVGVSAPACVDEGANGLDGECCGVEGAWDGHIQCA